MKAGQNAAMIQRAWIGSDRISLGAGPANGFSSLILRR